MRVEGICLKGEKFSVKLNKEISCFNDSIKRLRKDEVSHDLQTMKAS